VIKKYNILIKQISSFIKSESGASAMEYAILAAMVGLSVIGISTLATQVDGIFEAMINKTIELGRRPPVI
jgi:Flp pilus assembly pilin Flp